MFYCNYFFNFNYLKNNYSKKLYQYEFKLIFMIFFLRYFVSFFLRSSSVNETVKKRLYKQALDINQVSLLTPKSQRIQSTVSKVFGLDDPPPGFGLVYPKYYYLEQRRPLPMNPLKVIIFNFGYN